MSIIKKVRKIIRLVEGHEIYELEIQGLLTKILVRKNPPAQIQNEETEPGPIELSPKEDSCYITSPWVGTVRLKTDSNENLPVKVGEKIEPDMLLCVVKIMGTMNEIRAEKSGTIIGILVGNGQPVEYGTKLFKIKPNGEKP